MQWTILNVRVRNQRYIIRLVISSLRSEGSNIAYYTTIHNEKKAVNNLNVQQHRYGLKKLLYNHVMVI